MFTTLIELHLNFKQSKMTVLSFIVSIFLLLLPISNAAYCDLISPKTFSSTGDDFGLIMIPGSKIPGEKYIPLADKIQALFPGKLWIGVTKGWFVDMPNPLEISAAINGCLEQARYSHNLPRFWSCLLIKKSEN